MTITIHYYDTPATPAAPSVFLSPVRLRGDLAAVAEAAI